jgi:cell division protein FtsN
MKKSVIGICISLLCVGTGVYVNQQNNATSPVVSTVAKSTKDSKVNTNESKSKVSKHEEAENLEEVGNATNSEMQKKTDAVSKESSSVKAEAKSSTKAEIKTSVSSEGKKQTSSNQTNTAKKDNSTTSSSSSDTSKEPEIKPVEKPSTLVQEPVVEPAPTPESTRPSYACPSGVNQDVACDVILDQNHYFATYSSQAEADAAGVYYMNEVMYIGETEITNYSVQVVYRNDHSIAYYGLNLWSNGSLI